MMFLIIIGFLDGFDRFFDLVFIGFCLVFLVF